MAQALLFSILLTTLLTAQGPASLVRPRVALGIGAKTLLTPADFSYLGHYDVTAISNTSQGLTHRYVGGNLRFLSGGNRLSEFSIASLPARSA